MPAAPWTCSVFRGVDVSARKTMKDASKKQPSFSSVAIAGPGLLGGSLALAVRARMPHVHVRLWGRRPEPLEYALSIGAAHAVSTRVEEVVQGGGSCCSGYSRRGNAGYCDRHAAGLEAGRRRD